MGRRGLQLEIIASLFIVMLAGTGIVAVVMGSLALHTVQNAAFERLQLGARQISRIRLLRDMHLRELSAFLRVENGFEDAGEWSVLDARGRSLTGKSGTVGVESDRLQWALQSGTFTDGAGIPVREIVWLEKVVTGSGETGFLLGRVSRERVLKELSPWLRSGSWVLGMGALVFVVFGSYLLRNSIVLPLRALSAATRRVAAGELDVRMPVSGSNELSQLAERFNEMAASLERERDTVLQAFETLARSQRLATVGQLAAGVAHEVGNPVAAIFGYLDVADRDPELSARAADSVKQIRKEALRIRSLVRQLLDLARPEPLQLQPHSPHVLLRRAQALLAPQKLMRGVELVVDAAESLPQVRVDPRRLEQVLVNLVENAAHALQQVRHPTITLRARTSELAPHVGRRSSDVSQRRSASSLCIDVTDNGPGIPAEILDRIFDPFFTTKDPGEGTGLGLWNAHRLVEALGGRIDVQSEAGETRFSLVLPLADTEPGDHDAATHPDHR